MTLPRTPGIQRMPYELIAWIVKDLEVEDTFNLSLCCKQFQYIIREDRFCKPVIKTKASNTLEARDALESGQFSRALRRLVKRRNALSRASPYAVGFLACADSYKYSGGKLCYIVGERSRRWLRILDVRRSSSWELVVDIPMLILAALPEAADSRKYKFQVLYQEAGIVSCLFSLGRLENWLIIIKPEEHRILETYRLQSAARIFVRNNDKYLYFGTHSGEGVDGLKKWVLKGFDLQKLSWMSQPRMFLERIAGCDIGTTVCFEIIGEHFYGLANQTLFDTDNPDWTSYYCCFRFPLSQPCVEQTEWMDQEDSWRREHREGPIDNRWGFLSLETDEATGKIVILECRVEWLQVIGGARRRTYYTTEAVFRPKDSHGSQERTRTGTGTGRRVPDFPQGSGPIPSRQLQYVHAGDHSSIDTMFLRRKVYFCTYIRSCQTFLDLIDDTSEDTSEVQCVRLRTGHRTLNLASGAEPSADLGWSGLCIGNELPQALPPTEPYPSNKVFIWPPRQASSEVDPSVDRVQQLLNVHGRIESVIASGDERYIIYATTDGSKRGVKTLVLISFDPATRLEGMECGVHIPGQQVPGVPNKTTVPDAENREISSGMLQFGPNIELGAEDKVKCGSIYRSTSLSLPPTYDSAFSADRNPPPIAPAAAGTVSWTSYGSAMHLDLQTKFYFGR